MAHINGTITPDLTLLKILRAVCGTNFDRVMDHIDSKKPEFVDYRFAYCILARKYTTYSLAEIGAVIYKDHASVLHAKKRSYYKEVKEHIAKAKLILKL